MRAIFRNRCCQKKQAVVEALGVQPGLSVRGIQHKIKGESYVIFIVFRSLAVFGFLSHSFKRTSMSVFSPLIMLIGFAVMITAGCSGTESSSPRQTVKLGALLNLAAEDGLATKAAIELALEDLNSYATTAGRNVFFTCSFADTRMDPAEAESQLKNMHQQGISMFVGGPYSSSELQAIAPFVKQNPIALINASSTAIGLNHAGSHPFP